MVTGALAFVLAAPGAILGGWLLSQWDRGAGWTRR